MELKLKTFEEFRSSVLQLPAFHSIHQNNQRRFVRDAYNLAKEKNEKEIWMEMWMETAGKEAKASRASSTGKLLRVAKHIWNALADIEEAKKAAPASPPKLIKHLQILKAAHLLRAAYDDLGFIIGMDISAVHPRHRTDFEKRFRATYPHKFFSLVEEKFSEIPARLSRLDSSLAKALSSRLDKCKTSTGRQLRLADRYRIISRVFLAALAQHYPDATVRTALTRTPD